MSKGFFGPKNGTYANYSISMEVIRERWKEDEGVKNPQHINNTSQKYITIKSTAEVQEKWK